LIGIAWLGEVSAKHVGPLWMRGRHPKNVRRLLNLLEAQGLISHRLWYYLRSTHQPPVRYGKLWSLTEAGLHLVRDHPTFPKRYRAPRTRLMLAHDSVTTDVVVHMIAMAQPAGLSGVYLEREVKLNPPATRPIMDALMTLRTGGTQLPSGIVPWITDPPEPNEKVRRYAIENDRDSEAIAVILAKAHAYQHAATPEWIARNGPFPIPVWIAPSDKRRDAIMQAWMHAWPYGKWLMTTDAALAQDRWIEYFNGRVRERNLFTPANAEHEHMTGNHHGRL
jgi:hypothetical protein